MTASRSRYFGGGITKLLDVHQPPDTRRFHMAGSVCKVIIIGNLGADPEIRHTQDGKPIANLRIATSENWRDKTTGERKERTTWHRVVVFNEGLCRVVEQFLKKGSKIYLEGTLQNRKWTNQQGQDQYSTEVVLQNFNHTLTMLDGPGDRQGGGQAQGSQQGGYGQNSSNNMQAPIGQGTAGGGQSQQGAGFGGGTTGGGSFDKDLDDEIPF
jgi:single-strand DNA-binding protein